MGSRTRHESQATNLVALAYESALTPEPFAALLPELARAIDADAGMLALYAPELGQGEMPVSHDMPSELPRLYRDHFWSVDLWRLEVHRRRIPAGKAFTGSMVVPYRALLASEMYNDALRQYRFFDTCAGQLHRQGSAGAAISMLRARPKPFFGKAELRKLDALMPHMSRAFALHRRFAGLIGQRATLSAALDRLSAGAILCDRRGLVVHATLRAAALLEAADTLFVQRGRLRARDPDADRALAALFARGGAFETWCASGGAVAVRRNGGASPLRLGLYPARFGKLLAPEGRVAFYVLVDDPDDAPRATLDRIARGYRLTPSETKLLARLVAGDTIKEAAAALAISVNTARFQSKQILHKTGTHRQIDLLRLCLGLNPRPRDGA